MQIFLKNRREQKTHFFKVWVFIAFVFSCANINAEVFEVEQINITRVENFYYLNASINYSLHEQAIEILEKGLPIRLRFEVELFRERAYWFDKDIAEKEYIYSLLFNPITERYDLTREDTGDLLSFATTELAVQNLSYLSNLLLVEVKNLPSTKKVKTRLRMTIDVRNFPEPFQYLSQYWGDWTRSTEWYELALEPKVGNDNDESP